MPFTTRLYNSQCWFSIESVTETNWKREIVKTVRKLLFKHLYNIKDFSPKYVNASSLCRNPVSSYPIFLGLQIILQASCLGNAISHIRAYLGEGSDCLSVFLSMSCQQNASQGSMGLAAPWTACASTMAPVTGSLGAAGAPRVSTATPVSTVSGVIVTGLGLQSSQEIPHWFS